MTVGVDYRKIFDNSGATKLYYGAELIAAELNLLLNFSKYSLFFGNNMGLDCEKYLSLTNRVATFNLIKADIEELFSKYGRAILNKTEMKFIEDTNSIEINLTVSTDKSGYNAFIVPLVLSN